MEKFNPNRTVFSTGDKSIDPKKAFKNFTAEQLAKPVERQPQEEVVVRNPVLDIKRSPEERRGFKQEVSDKLNKKMAEIADILEKIKKI